MRDISHWTRPRVWSEVTANTTSPGTLTIILCLLINKALEGNCLAPASQLPLATRPPTRMLFVPKGPTPKAKGVSGSRDGEKLPS